VVPFSCASPSLRSGISQLRDIAFWFSNAALNITTDIMIFALPIPLLKQLQLPKRQKLGLIFVFTFGAL